MTFQDAKILSLNASRTYKHKMDGIRPTIIGPMATGRNEKKNIHLRLHIIDQFCTP